MTDVAEKKNRGRVGGEAAHSPIITTILWAVIPTKGRNLFSSNENCGRLSPSCECSNESCGKLSPSCECSNESCDRLSQQCEDDREDG